MATAPSKSFTRHKASTIFVRVHADDWPYVKRGMRTTFISSKVQPIGVRERKLPTPVVAFTSRRGIFDARLMILRAVQVETLGAVDPVALGFESMAEFRRYYMRRERKKFPPGRTVHIYTVSEVTEEALTECGTALIEHLYGEFMDGRDH